MKNNKLPWLYKKQSISTNHKVFWIPCLISELAFETLISERNGCLCFQKRGMGDLAKDSYLWWEIFLM